MPEATTRKTLRQGVIEKLYFPRHPVVGTTTSAGTGELIDTILSGGGLDTDYLHAWVYLPATSVTTRVSDVDLTNSKLVLLPTASPGSGVEYELHYVFASAAIHSKINEVLQTLEAHVQIPVSLAADGDMETSGVGSWTASSATVTKDVTAANVFFGRQSLSVAATGGNGQARSASINIPAGTAVFCSALVKVGTAAAAEARFILWDDVNGVQIARGVSRVSGWSELSFLATIPATADQVSLRLESTTSGQTIYFDHAVIIPIKRRLFEFPATFVMADDIERVVSYERGSGLDMTGSENNYRMSEKQISRWTTHDLVKYDRGINAYRFGLEDSKDITRPIFAVGGVKFATLTDDTTTTAAPHRLVEGLVLADMFELLAQWYTERNDESKAAVYLAIAEQTRRKLMPLWERFRPRHGTIRGASTN